MQDEHRETYLTLFESLVDAKFQIDQRNYGRAHDILTYAQLTVGRAFINAGGNKAEIEAILEDEV